MATKRKDKSRKVLRKGESQRPDGTYQFRWTDENRKRHCIYARNLDDLRYKEDEIDKDKKDDASRIALKIQLQNTTSHGITSWSAFIVLSDETGKVVLRSTVEGGAMASRESKTFQFVWSDEEKEYGQLSPYSLDSSKLIAALNQVILK